MPPGLVWSPTSSFLFSALESNRLTIAIAPFIKAEALQQLLAKCNSPEQIQFVTCWDNNSLLSKVSDLEVFPILREVGASLFIHPRIHLKLFVLSNNLAFHTSSNITLRGLGLSTVPNVEIGSEVSLSVTDWSFIYQVLNESIRVDDQMYRQALDYLNSNSNSMPNPPNLNLFPEADRRFSIDSLPVCESPEAFLGFLDRLGSGEIAADDQFVYAVAHDLCHFLPSVEMSQADRVGLLSAAFQSQPFVKSIVALIRNAGTARFGLVTDWIQQNCSDRPIPYRKDIKETVRVLYNWLEYFYEEISWSVPGARSMVIRWDKN